MADAPGRATRQVDRDLCLWPKRRVWRGCLLGHGKIKEKTLLRIEHLSGIGLIALALIHGGRIAWQLAKHKM